MIELKKNLYEYIAFKKRKKCMEDSFFDVGGFDPF